MTAGKCKALQSAALATSNGTPKPAFLIERDKGGKDVELGVKGCIVNGTVHILEKQIPGGTTSAFHQKFCNRSSVSPSTQEISRQLWTHYYPLLACCAWSYR
jgi:hypothetical protein